MRCKQYSSRVPGFLIIDATVFCDNDITIPNFKEQGCGAGDSDHRHFIGSWVATSAKKLKGASSESRVSGTYSLEMPVLTF
jgi:hypothetical protein